MIILMFFAFLAGIVTILSPCILPILPVILATSVGDNQSQKRPYGIVVGFILSFTFFTLFLSSIVKLFGVDAEALRNISVFVIGLFGFSLLVPAFQLMLESLFVRLANFVPNIAGKTGFAGGMVIGLSLGLLWTPCVGPILASVISLAITGTVTSDAFFITLAYSLGTAIPMYLVIMLGRNLFTKIPWLLGTTGKIQKFFGLIMILVALAIYQGYDRSFQTYVLNTFPQYGVGLTKLEDQVVVKKELDSMNKPDVKLNRKGNTAPELKVGGTWFNSDPLTLQQLRGKVVLIDFWTYSCINCQRTLPYLKEWDRKYRDKGLIIIGVHAPEFEFEKIGKNVEDAITDFGIKYPVMQDNDFATWRAYKNRYWPAKYFIDKDGNIRHLHEGEGEYDESETIIQELLKETGVEINEIMNNPVYVNHARTPETYVGYVRMRNLASPEIIQENKVATYTQPSKLGRNEFALNGKWLISEEYASPKAGATLHFNFDAKNVYLVMKNTGNPARVKVYVDDKLVNTVNITEDTLYTLVELDDPGRHLLKLEFEDSNAQLFAFTFG